MLPSNGAPIQPVSSEASWQSTAGGTGACRQCAVQHDHWVSNIPYMPLSLVHNSMDVVREARGIGKHDALMCNVLHHSQ